MADAKAFKVPPIRPANRWFVLVGVTAGLGVSALPLYYKQVRDKEQQLAEARDQYYEAKDGPVDAPGNKDDARSQRLSTK